MNLTNHSYFNLDGGGSVLDHELQVFASRITENDAGCLPTGRLLEVEETPFDFRIPKQIGAEINADDAQLRCGGGYDHNYVLSGRRAAVLRSGRSGIEMTVETDQPGMQVYTANELTQRPGQARAPPWAPGMRFAWRHSCSPMAFTVTDSPLRFCGRESPCTAKRYSPSDCADSIQKQKSRRAGPICPARRLF